MLKKEKLPLAKLISQKLETKKTKNQTLNIMLKSQKSTPIFQLIFTMLLDESDFLKIFKGTFRKEEKYVANKVQ